MYFTPVLFHMFFFSLLLFYHYYYYYYYYYHHYYYYYYYYHHYYYYYCFICLAKVKLIGHPQIFLVVQLRRLFDWTNMAAALPQFFGAARQQCVEVRFQWS